MNILLLSESDALALIAKQSGLHQLAPVRLLDGTYFLSADVLTETETGIFAGQLDGINYTQSTLEAIAELLPKPEIDVLK